MASSASMARIIAKRILSNFQLNKHLGCLQLGEERLYSTQEGEPGQPNRKEKISKAMKAYLERAHAHEEFMKQEQHDFNVGRRHLANMMGVDPEHFAQQDIDKSIEYLFPSGLFEPRARPIMRPPEEVFPKTKSAEFDESGRPHHCLFYTTRPYFSQLLHDCADKLAELDEYEDKMIRRQQKPDHNQNLDLMGSVWLSQEGVEKIVLEKIVEIEYKKFITAMERIANHPYAYRAADFVKKFRQVLMAEKSQAPPMEPQDTPDGRRYVCFKDCSRKSTRGEVTLIVPGTGKITINGKGIDYFSDTQSRKQVLFPLLFSDMLGKVDVEAKMEDGGESGQAGATRYGISMALRSFVPPAMVEQMRLAGLLTVDYRRRERKKPGQKGARRKYTWKKR